jgi:hypothetical protein
MVIFSHAMVNKETTTGAQSSILRTPAAKDSPLSPARIGLMSIKLSTTRRRIGFGGALAASLLRPGALPHMHGPN